MKDPRDLARMLREHAEMLAALKNLADAFTSTEEDWVRANEETMNNYEPHRVLLEARELIARIERT
jgi:hypothetical protein